jgi:hypothetical protein
MIRPGRRKRARQEAAREERIASLEAKAQSQDDAIRLLKEENARLRRGLERQATRLGEDPQTDTTVRIGGQAVDLYPLGPSEWVRGLGKLPDFFLRFVTVTMKQKLGEGPEAKVGEEDLAEFLEEIKTWIRASVGPEDLERIDLARLSMPEAKAAAEVVIAINGYDQEIEEFFRLRGAGSRPGSSGAPVRDPS